MSPKLVIVTILTLNALLLHSVVLPRVTSRVGQPLFETSFGRLPTMSTLLGAVSAVSWLFAAYLGVARELNGQMNLIPILGSYLAALLLTWALAIALSFSVRHRRTWSEFPKGTHKAIKELIAPESWKCQKPGALRRELDCLVAETSVQHCGPDLKHTVSTSGRPRAILM